MSMSDWVRQMLNDDSDEQRVKTSGIAMRGGGGGVPPSYLNSSATAARAINQNPPMDDRYVQTANDAKDDGTHAPEDVKTAVVSYSNDPRYKQLDDMRGKIVNSMGAGGSGFWNWATGGKHFNAELTKLNAIEAEQRHIAQRYIDDATLWSISQEQFDYGKPTGERYNEQTGTWERQYVGSQGSEKWRQAPDKYEEKTLSTGAKRAFKVVPNARYMEEAGIPTASESSAPLKEGPFEGGVAKAEPMMKEIGVDPETAAKIATEKKHQEYYGAQIEKAGERNLITAAPGSAVIDPSTKKVVYNVPMTPTQQGAGRGGRGDDGAPMTREEIRRTASARADIIMPKTQMADFNPNFAKDKEALIKRLESELFEAEGYKGGATATETAAPERSVITLGKNVEQDGVQYKSGQKVEVESLPNGNLRIVRLAPKAE